MQVVIWCAGTILFFCAWTFLTLCLLIAQERYQVGGTSYSMLYGIVGTFYQQMELATTTEDSYVGHGVQIVVGHYNGKLPDEKKKNLTAGSMQAAVLIDDR